MLKKIDWKYIIITLLLFVGSFVSYRFSEQILSAIKSFFEFPYLNICAGTIATIITLVHKIKTRKFTFSATMSFNDFRIPVEDLLSFIGSPITIVGSLSLAKGLYLQMTSGTKSFSFIDNSIELIFIGLVTAYLFFISVMELLKNGQEIITRQETNEQPIKPIPESEVENKTVPKVE